MWKLVIEDDEGKRTIVPLTRSEYTIGRREGSSIRLTERNVSRGHARLSRKAPSPGDSQSSNTSFVLEDMTSYNGVFVNWLLSKDIQLGLAKATLQDSRRQDLPSVSEPERQPVKGATYLETQREDHFDDLNAAIKFVGDVRKSTT